MLRCIADGWIATFSHCTDYKGGVSISRGLEEIHANQKQQRINWHSRRFILSALEHNFGQIWDFKELPSGFQDGRRQLWPKCFAWIFNKRSRKTIIWVLFGYVVGRLQACISPLRGGREKGEERQRCNLKEEEDRGLASRRVNGPISQEERAAAGLPQRKIIGAHCPTKILGRLSKRFGYRWWLSLQKWPRPKPFICLPLL